MSTQASRITYENALCAELLADLRKMVALCHDLPGFTESAVGALKRLEASLAENKNEEGAAFDLYHALACPTILAVAANMYATAGSTACAAQLRRVVKGIHRLGAELDLE